MNSFYEEHANTLWARRIILRKMLIDAARARESHAEGSPEYKAAAVLEGQLRDWRGELQDEINDGMKPGTADFTAAAIISEVLTGDEDGEPLSFAGGISVMLALEHLMPDLTGLIAKHADELLSVFGESSGWSACGFPSSLAA